MRDRRNYYHVLHVQPDAPAEIIHMSYLTLMKRLRMHPDLGGDHWNAALINEAYATLKDPDRRAAYDRRVGRQAATDATRAATPRAISTGSRARAELPRCAFCGTSHPADAVAAGARCDACASPLRPAVRYRRSATARRALDRVARTIPLILTLPGARQVQMAGTTEDLSITGMQFTTPLELLPHELIRIECAFCGAVAVVRHVRATRAKKPSWRVGVEFVTLLIKETRGSIVSKRA